MATTDFGKIVLKSSAKMSLNDRFQLIRQTQLKRSQTNAINNKVVNKSALQLRQGSQKNKRLALQMANRPSVLNALRTNNNQGIKQRLGNQTFNNQSNNNNIRNINAKNRNQKRFINRSNVNTIAVNRNRININRNQINNNRNQVNNNRNQIRTQFQNRRNNSQNIGVIVGVRQTVPKAIKKNRKNTFQRFQSFKTGSPAKANIKQRRRGIGGQFRNQKQTNKTGAKKLKINRNFNARNNAGQQQQQQKKRNVKPDKQQLDNDLDAYMAGTKSYLDAELDAYMSQTN